MNREAQPLLGSFSLTLLSGSSHCKRRERKKIIVRKITEENSLFKYNTSFFLD